MARQPIIVALDGSEVSERAVPYAVALAHAVDMDIVAASVCHTGSASTFVGKQMAEQMGRAEHDYLTGYLGGLKEKLAAKGDQIETELRSGDPVDELLNILNERQGRYLVLATHGRSGLNRWRYGSVASRLIREASVPTLVVGPKVLETEPAEVTIKRILVPLDGSPLAEQALPIAGELCQKAGASLLLARGVQWASQVYPTFDPVALNRALDEAATAYLGDVRTKTPAVIETAVLRGSPADALIQFVEDAKIDLVVMTSHSRAGLARAILGSVADRMLQCRAPVLLVRPEDRAR
jgi:nucleotide-binding universal stress UspA family protein